MPLNLASGQSEQTDGGEEIKSPFKRRVLQFFGTADMHAAHFITDPKSEQSRKVYWALFLVGSVIFLGAIVGHRVHVFLKYERSTRLEMNEHIERSPHLKICTWDAFVPSSFTASDVINAPRSEPFSIRLSDSDFTVDEAGRRFVKSTTIDALKLLNDSSPDLTRYVVNPAVNWRPLVRAVIVAGDSTPLEAPDHYRTADVVQRAMRRPGEAITTCSVEGGVRGAECVAMWERVYSTWGVCYVMDQALIPAGKQLSLWLNFDLECFLMKPAMLMDYYELYVEDAAEAANSVISRLLIPVIDNGSMVAARLHKATNIRRIKPPYSPPCGDDSSLHYLAPPYTKTKCREECIAEAMVAARSCLPFFMEGPPGSLRCTNESIIDSKYKYWDLWANADCSRCPRACDEWSYEVSIVQHSPTHVFYRHANIALRSDAMTTQTTVVEYPSYPVDVMASEIGGIMSLFLGISALTVVHFIEFVSRELSQLFVGVKSRDKSLKISVAEMHRKE